MRLLSIAITISLALSGAVLAQDFPEISPYEEYVGDCGSRRASADLCRVKRPISEAEARERLAGRAVTFWRDGETFSVLAVRDSETVTLCCAIQGPMARLPGTNLWVLTVRIPRLDEAIIDVGFRPQDWREKPEIWRGPSAPPAPVKATQLKGRLLVDQIDSRALGGRRGLHVYRPPGFREGVSYPVVYLADGDGVPGIAAIIEPLILSGKVKPLLLVGLDSGQTRYEEYVGTRFEAHEAFLLNEVMPRMAALHGASSRRQDRLLMGSSNGADWAAKTAARNPAVFGQAAILSPLSASGQGLDKPGRPRLFLSAGYLEAPFLNTANRVAIIARRAPEPLLMTNLVSGHSDVQFEMLYGPAVIWAFGRGGRR